jgi:dnd system-associated protein 4
MPSPDKIFIEKEIHDTYIRLTKEEGSDELIKPFRTMKDLFLAAAVEGYLNDTFTPLKAPKEIFVWSTLLNDEHALNVLRSIALAKTEDPNILVKDDEIAKIAEGYANGGIHLLTKRILDTDATELEEAAIFMSEYTAKIDEI